MKRLLIGLAIVTLAAQARADDQVRPLTDPLTLKACGECHMAFQPAFLPARSWNRIMDELDRHFGENAALAPDKAANIRKTLTDGAADRTGGRVATKYLRQVEPDAVPIRITEARAFVRKHDFPARTWTRPEILTKSNCPACHLGAEKGIYDDD